jgi:hypothetical protein
MFSTMGQVDTIELSKKEWAMLQTIEVEIDASGHIHLLEPLSTFPVGRALLTLLTPLMDETTILAEPTLAEDWMKPEKL